MKKFKRQITIVLLLAMVFSNIQPLISYASSNNFESGSLIGSEVGNVENQKNVELKNSLESESDVILGESKFSDDENKNEDKDEEVKDIEESEIDPETKPEETNPETEKPEEDIDKPQSEETVDFLVTKNWINSDLFKTKPIIIVVNLLADGKKIDEVRISEEDNWKYTFENLPKAIDGVDIKYTVEENPISNYKSSIDYVSDTHAVITNTYEPMGLMSNILNDEEPTDVTGPEKVEIIEAIRNIGKTEDGLGLDLVTQGPVVIYAINEQGQWVNGITGEDGKLIDPENPPTLEVGQGLSFKVKWLISEIQSKKLEVGDYFEFNLPSNYFEFKKTGPFNISAENETTGQAEVIGTYEIVASTDSELAKIKIVLNETATEKSEITDGYVSIIGKAKKTKGKDETIHIGEQALPGIIIEEKPMEELGDALPIKKNGWQDTNAQTVTWEILVNYEDYKSVYNNDDVTSVDTKTNLIVTDELPAGVEFGTTGSIDLAMPIYAAMPRGSKDKDGNNVEGNVSSTIVENGWNNYGVLDNPYFIKIEQEDGETWDDFQTRFRRDSKPISYGIFIDKDKDEYDGYRNRVIMNFGDLPGDLKSPKNLDEIKTLINNPTNNLSDFQKTKTIEAYEKIFAVTKTTKTPEGTGVIGFRLVFKDLSVLDTVQNGEKLENSATMYWSDKELTDDAETVYYEKLEGGANTGDPQSVTIRKLDAVTKEELSGAEFRLQKRDSGGVYQDFIPEDGIEVRTTDSNGLVVFKNLEKGDYKVVEEKAPTGYTDEITFSKDEGFFTIDGKEEKTIFITAYNKKELIDIEGTKTWEYGDNPVDEKPTSIVVELYKTLNGKTNKVKDVTVTPDENGDWKYSFKDLPKYEGEVEIVYSVREKPVLAYTNKITGYDIENTYNPLKTTVHVTKSWDDENNQDGIRPKSIKVQLYADDDKHGDEVELNESNNWSHSWTELDKKSEGINIKYTVKEVSVPNGYDVTINESNLEYIVIVNKHEPETTEIDGEKTWVDGNNQDGNRPKSIVVELYKTVAGKTDKVKDVTVTPDKNGEWKYSFKDLPKYENGIEIIYSVKESPVLGYTNEVTGYDIKNTYNPLKTTVHVTKSWDDKNNQDGIRPKSIKVQLYADGKEHGDEVELNESNNWSHSWTNLDKKSEGTDIKYTVKEVSVPNGYDVTINDSNLGVILIVNKHTPTTPPTIPPTNPTPEIDIEGEKTWEDYNNEGKRPSSIVVNLLADNVIVRTKTVTPDSNGNWKYSFTNLPKYKNDKLIKYTVEEVVPENYEASYSGYNIKNRYTEEETNITVKKVWDDENNKDNLRTDSIKVQLYGNGEKRGEVIELNESNNWSYNWTELKKIVDGREVTYTVREVEVPSGYEVNYDESVRGSVTITNTHKPEITNTPDEPREEPKEESKPEEAVKALKLSKILPKTGIGAMTSLTVSGISLLAVGMYLLKKKK